MCGGRRKMKKDGSGWREALKGEEADEAEGGSSLRGKVGRHALENNWRKREIKSRKRQNANRI